MTNLILCGQAFYTFSLCDFTKLNRQQLGDAVINVIFTRGLIHNQVPYHKCLSFTLCCMYMYAKQTNAASSYVGTVCIYHSNAWYSCLYNIGYVV